MDENGVVTEQPLKKGVYKKWANSVKTRDGGVHAYCPPEHVEAEMDRLIEWHRRHVMDEVAPEVEAAWLHHRFTQIHPYPDGNGRIARALASLVLVKCRLLPLSVRTEERTAYWDALRDADDGHILQFIKLIKALQGRDLVEFSQFVKLPGPGSESAQSVEELIQEIKQDVLSGGRIQPEGWSTVLDRMRILHGSCQQRLDTIANELRSALGRSPHSSSAQSPKPINSTSRNALAWLSFDPPGLPQITFNFGTGGEQSRGVAQCEAYWIGIDKARVRIDSNPFIFTYAESQASQRKRFAGWMETVIFEGLRRWRATLTA